MTREEILNTISVLSKVVEANNPMEGGDPKTNELANNKIKELIPLI